MQVIHSDRVMGHRGAGEFDDGKMIPPRDDPSRVLSVKSALKEAPGFDFVEAQPGGIEPILRVHGEDYLAFLQNAWPDWVAFHEGREGPVPDALPLIIPNRALRNICPKTIDGKLGYFALDVGTPIMSGTWDAALTSAHVALEAERRLADSGEAVFALTRPPGHHASTDVLGGYCFLNHAAIAAQAMIDRGAERVAILDVDYHHGNGTQDIFYRRGDVFVVNIHADPDFEFPYFLGRSDETGDGGGEFRNLNIPLQKGTDWAQYVQALDHACSRITEFGPDGLVISWGFDTYEHDPLSKFTLQTSDFASMGARMAQLGVPTLILLEGGYAIEDLGRNTLSGLTGFLNG